MEKRIRLHALDALRGACLISMAAFHGMWNLVYLFGVEAPWYKGTAGFLWQQSICWTFLLLAGFCWRMSRSHLKRGLLVFGGGILVSAVTHIFMPEEAITFGILTCTGSCVLLMILLDRVFCRIPPVAGMIGSFAAFVLTYGCDNGTAIFGQVNLPGTWYRNLFTTWLGFPMGGFVSADYFPLIPWLLLFVTGYFLYGILHSRGLDEKLFARGKIPVLNWLGRHSLLVYLLHQPILYGLCLLIFLMACSMGATRFVF